jgi:hypothetical protein
MLKKKLDESNIDNALSLINGVTDESLGQLKEDIEYFLGEDEKKQSQKDTSNPFLALFGKYDKSPEVKKETKTPEKKLEDVKLDNWYEKNFFREKASEISVETLFNLFDIYKKAHGMASFT